MVVVCSAPGCSAKKEISSKSTVQFHRFPLRKPDVLAKWIKAMKCANFRPTATSYLCSAHFAATDYELKPTNAGKHLKPNAVPSYFIKRRPGRKKKTQSENETVDEPKNDREEYAGNKATNERVEQYLKAEADVKVESNLAEIIGNQEKGTFHVLIVGDDGKITNSEYIFKKELMIDDEIKPDSDTAPHESIRYSENENVIHSKESIDEKSSQTDASPEVTLYNYRDFKNKKKIKKLENTLTLTRKKVKFLQMKCKRMNIRMNELRILLKLLVLKRGKGEKNLKQLLDDYEKCELDEMKVEIKDESSYY